MAPYQIPEFDYRLAQEIEPESVVPPFQFDPLAELGKAGVKFGAKKALGGLAAKAGTRGLGGIVGNAASMGALPLAAIAGGTYLGGQALFDMLGGKKPGLLGRATLGIATGGLSELPGLLGFQFDKNRSGEERNRLLALQKGGMNVPQHLIDGAPTDGRSLDDLIFAAQDQHARGQATAQDVAFAKSRDINDLKGSGQSITGYSAFAEHDKDWFNRSKEEQTAYANQLLDKGLVSEGRGQIKIDWDKAPEIGAIANKIQAALAPQRSRSSSPGIDKNGNRIKY